MDIISMQIANKVLKRMNTEFNGLYDMFVATGGQKIFRTSKPHDIENKGLHVYVNGFHAVEQEDYTHLDQHQIEFKKGLMRGDIVLLSTQVVGIPKFEVINPAYDDSSIKSELVQLGNRIQSVIEALDDNGDGSIIDTIANLKKMWQDADGDLIKLIELTATKEELAVLSARIEEVAGVVPPSYDDSALTQRVSTLENTATGLERRVVDLENGTTVRDILIADDKTGRKHKLHLSDGVLSAKLVGTPMEITHTAPSSVVMGVATEFRLNIVANADLNQKIKLNVAHNNKVTVEYNNGSQWVPFESTTIESLTNLGYSLRVTGVETGTHEIRIDMLKFDNNVSLGSTVFSVAVSEPPSSIVSGTVTLNGADHQKVLVNLQKQGDENTLATGILEDGAFNLKVTEGGSYTLSIANSTTTHSVSGASEIPLTIELGTNYADNSFTLELIPVPELKTMKIEHNPHTVNIGATVALTDFNVVVKDATTDEILQANVAITSMIDGASTTVTDIANIASVAGSAVVNIAVTLDGYRDTTAVLVLIVEEGGIQ